MKKNRLYSQILLITLLILALFGCSVKSQNGSAEIPMAVAETAAFSYGNGGFVNASMKTKGMTAAYTDGVSYEEDETGVNINGKKLIKTVEISSETKEFDKSIEWLKSYIESFSGIIDNSYIDSGNKTNKYYRKNAFFSVRVPAASLDSFLSKIGDNLNVTFQQESITDVTDSYDDTEKRKNTLLIEEEKLNELLRKAKAVEDLVAIESKLSEVRFEIQNIENRLKRYDKQIDYSTINISISEVIDLTENIEKEDYSKSNLIRLLNKNLEDTKKFVVKCAVFLFTHIPAICFSLIVIVIVLSIVLLIRNVKKKKPKNNENN